MRLDDRISAIFNEIEMRRYNEQQADWLYRNFNEALNRARKLEDLAEAVTATAKNYSAFDKEKPGKTCV